MARPPARELTERELELMHVFWRHGDQTAAEVRQRLADDGRELAYTTVATLMRILTEKEFLQQVNRSRPFVYRPIRSFQDVSRRLVNDLVERVFQGSRSQLLVQLLAEHDLSDDTRAQLEQLLAEHSS